MHPNFWLVFPVAIAVLLSYLSFFRIFVKGNASRNYLHIMTILYKCFTPWMHEVTFPVFYTADILTSVGGLFKDVGLLVSAGQLPDYL